MRMIGSGLATALFAALVGGASAESPVPPATFDFISEVSVLSPYHRARDTDETLRVTALRLRYADFQGTRNTTEPTHLIMHQGEQNAITAWIGGASPFFDSVDGQVTNFHFPNLAGRELVAVDLITPYGLHQLLLYEFTPSGPAGAAITKFSKQPPPSNVATPVLVGAEIEVRNTTIIDGKKVIQVSRYQITGLECTSAAGNTP